MVKPLFDYTFRQRGGMWTDSNGVLLSDVLTEWGIIVDERTQFARLYDYDSTPNVCIFYRASAGMVKITVWKHHEK